MPVKSKVKATEKICRRLPRENFLLMRDVQYMSRSGRCESADKAAASGAQWQLYVIIPRNYYASSCRDSITASIFPPSAIPALLLPEIELALGEPTSPLRSEAGISRKQRKRSSNEDRSPSMKTVPSCTPPPPSIDRSHRVFLANTARK